MGDLIKGYILNIKKSCYICKILPFCNIFIRCLSAAFGHVVTSILGPSNGRLTRLIGPVTSLAVPLSRSTSTLQPIVIGSDSWLFFDCVMSHVFRQREKDSRVSMSPRTVAPSSLEPRSLSNLLLNLYLLRLPIVQ